VSPLWPGATIGIIGGGQLARMMALEAKRMGYRIAVLDPDANGPAASVADLHIAAAIDDVAAARLLAAQCDVVTLDTEHVPAELLRELEEHRPVRPSSHVLGVVQDRLAQRLFLESRGLPQVRHAELTSSSDIALAASKVGFPCVLKTRRDGYDGKGQAAAGSLAELESAWNALGCVPTIVEAFVHFDKEVSVLLARGLDGEIRFYDVAENVHRRHVLHTTRAPASISPALVTLAEEIGAQIATDLQHVGMIAVEFFLTHDGEMLVNEIAPRTHNSGHYTFGACVTSQFEQHLRAICGLPLGDTALLSPVVMLNLLGDSWLRGGPDWLKVVTHPSIRFHVYGKKLATSGRKMGHLLVLGDSVERALSIAESIELSLRRDDGRSNGTETPNAGEDHVHGVQTAR
jgi:5-(carboxyamino)imidazole ribonucleotide synthase